MKMGCKKMAYKAHTILHQYIVYSDYAIPNHLTFMSKYQKRLARQQQLDELRADREQERVRAREKVKERERKSERERARERERE